MRRWLQSAVAGVLLTGGAPAVVQAQTEGYTVVPMAERLTFGGVLADASAEVQGMMALMAAGAVAAIVVWAMGLRHLGRADAPAIATALGRLRVVRSATAPIGFVTGAYVLFHGFMGIANVRPTPTLTVLAPGFAEATLAVMLGVTASAVAAVCERHLETQVRRAAA